MSIWDLRPITNSLTPMPAHPKVLSPTQSTAILMANDSTSETQDREAAPP